MFLPYKSDTGTLQPWEYMPAVAGTYQAGQLLTVTNCKVAALSAASPTTPPYLCMADITVAEGETIPVLRVAKNIIFETALDEEDESVEFGSMLEVSKGGMFVDGHANGTFEVTWLEGTAAGSAVLGRFL
ncbi:MAG: hypothetical protein ACI3W5_07445 [Faecousia sp.]